MPYDGAAQDIPSRLQGPSSAHLLGTDSLGRDLLSRIKAVAGFRPSFLVPVVGLERGLTDPIVELNMGQTAELLAHLFAVSRHDADQYSVESHQLQPFRS